MVYAVIPIDTIEDLQEKILAVDQKACLEEAPTLYFVSFSGTSKQLIYELGYGDRDKSLITLRVHEYYGIASPETWEWLEVRKNGY